ncbi:MAG TPA: hypothetical protein VN781_00830 [Acidimicrobiales bacterium]|nr:hypothetical protein [Acidimicrobiales bacterium]
MGMLEVVISISLLLIIIVPLSYLFTNVIGQAAAARQEVTAIRLADSLLEQLNYTGPPNDSNGQPEVGTSLAEGSPKVSGVVYTETALFSWSPAGSGTPDLCTSGLAPELLLQVTVTWSPNHSITDSTLLNFPPSGVVTEGFLGIQVNGDPSGSPPADVSGISWANRVKTVPVLVSGTSLTTSYSLHPASNGCTFLELTTGTYSVQVGTGPTALYTANYNEASSETQPTSSATTISVNTDEITEVIVQYDEGADVALTYPSTTATEDGVVCPNVSGLICVVAGQTATASTSPNTNPIAAALIQTTTGWSVASLPSSLVRIESAGCSSGACIVVGYSSAGGAAAVAQASAPTTWTTSALPAGANLNAVSQIVCPASATTPACFVLGTNTSGKGVILSATISGSSPHTVTWTQDTVPSVTSFSQITCPSASATPICFVIGTSATSVIASFTSGTTWTAYTAPGGTTVGSFSSLACPSTTVCYATGTTTGGSAVILSLGSGTWTKDTLPSGGGFSTSTTGYLACPSTSQCYATATGKTSGGGSVAPMIFSTTSTTWSNMTIPGGGAGSLGPLVCASTTVCFVPGLSTASPAAPIVWSLKSGPTAWVSDTLPGGLASLNSIVCPATNNCLALATNATGATIVSTTGGSSPTWTSDTISGTSGSPVLLSGLVCMATNSCEAAGATETGAVVLDDTTSSPVFSGSGTPTGLSGLLIDNPPILISNLNLAPSTTLELIAPTTSVAPLLQIGPLFPFSSGYSVAVGECASELTAASASAATTPGAVSSPNEATVTLPMGLLPVQVVDKNTGLAVNNATVTIQDSCSPQLTPLSGSNPANYSLPNSTIDGLSRADVIYGTYNVTVASGGNSKTWAVTVSPTSVTVGSTTTYLPNPVVLAD